MEKHRIYTMSVASVYPHYVAKARKRTAESDNYSLTGYSQEEWNDILKNRPTLGLC